MLIQKKRFWKKKRKFLGLLLPIAARQSIRHETSSLPFLFSPRLAGRRGRSPLNRCATWRPTWTWTWRETWTSSWPWLRNWGQGCTPLCLGSRFTPACRSGRCSTRCERQPRVLKVRTRLQVDWEKSLPECFLFYFFVLGTELLSQSHDWLVAAVGMKVSHTQTWFTGSIIRRSSLLNGWIIHAFSRPPVIINASINLLPWNLAARPDRTLIGVIKSSIYSALTPRLCVMQRSSKSLVCETVALKARWGVRLFRQGAPAPWTNQPWITLSGSINNRFL